MQYTTRCTVLLSIDTLIQYVLYLRLRFSVCTYEYVGSHPSFRCCPERNTVSDSKTTSCPTHHREQHATIVIFIILTMSSNRLLRRSSGTVMRTIHSPSCTTTPAAIPPARQSPPRNGATPSAVLLVFTATTTIRQVWSVPSNAYDCPIIQMGGAVVRGNCDCSVICDMPYRVTSGCQSSRTTRPPAVVWSGQNLCPCPVVVAMIPAWYSSCKKQNAGKCMFHPSWCEPTATNFPLLP